MWSTFPCFCAGSRMESTAVVVTTSPPVSIIKRWENTKSWKLVLDFTSFFFREDYNFCLWVPEVLFPQYTVLYTKLIGKFMGKKKNPSRFRFLSAGICLTSTNPCFRELVFCFRQSSQCLPVRVASVLLRPFPVRIGWLRVVSRSKPAVEMRLLGLVLWMEKILSGLDWGP